MQSETTTSQSKTISFEPLSIITHIDNISILERRLNDMAKSLDDAKSTITKITKDNESLQKKASSTITRITKDNERLQKKASMLSCNLAHEILLKESLVRYCEEITHDGVTIDPEEIARSQDDIWPLIMEYRRAMYSNKQ